MARLPMGQISSFGLDCQVKCIDIYIPPHTGKPEQQQFTM